MGIDPVAPNPENIHSLNRYAYANNNPYKFVDPDGRLPILIPLAAALLFEGGNLALESAYDAANPCGDCVRSSGVAIPSGPAAITGYKAGKALGQSVVRAEQEVINAAERTADAAYAAGKRTGAAAELIVGNRFFTGVSGEAVSHNSQVTGVLMSTKQSQRAAWHSGCAEIVCLDKALNAGINPSGGTMKAVNIGVSGTGHNTPKAPCSSCKDIMNYFGVGH